MKLIVLDVEGFEKEINKNSSDSKPYELYPLEREDIKEMIKKHTIDLTMMRIDHGLKSAAEIQLEHITKVVSRKP